MTPKTVSIVAHSPTIRSLVEYHFSEFRLEWFPDLTRAIANTREIANRPVIVELQPGRIEEDLFEIYLVSNGFSQARYHAVWLGASDEFCLIARNFGITGICRSFAGFPRLVEIIRHSICNRSAAPTTIEQTTQEHLPWKPITTDSDLSHS